MKFSHGNLLVHKNNYCTHIYYTLSYYRAHDWFDSSLYPKKKDGQSYGCKRPFLLLHLSHILPADGESNNRGVHIDIETPTRDSNN